MLRRPRKAGISNSISEVRKRRLRGREGLFWDHTANSTELLKRTLKNWEVVDRDRVEQ